MAPQHLEQKKRRELPPAVVLARTSVVAEVVIHADREVVVGDAASILMHEFPGYAPIAAQAIFSTESNPETGIAVIQIARRVDGTEADFDVGHDPVLRPQRDAGERIDTVDIGAKFWSLYSRTDSVSGFTVELGESVGANDQRRRQSVRR